jgi:hypothetical protein
MSKLLETVLGMLFFATLIGIFLLGVATFAKHGERFVPGVVEHLSGGQ